MLGTIQIIYKLSMDFIWLKSMIPFGLYKIKWEDMNLSHVDHNCGNWVRLCLSYLHSLIFIYLLFSL